MVLYHSVTSWMAAGSVSDLIPQRLSVPPLILRMLLGGCTNLVLPHWKCYLGGGEAHWRGVAHVQTQSSSPPADFLLWGTIQGGSVAVHGTVGPPRPSQNRQDAHGPTAAAPLWGFGWRTPPAPRGRSPRPGGLTAARLLKA